jgi:hypothetical protein
MGSVDGLATLGAANNAALGEKQIGRSNAVPPVAGHC